MTRLILFLFIFSMGAPLMAQHKPAYVIYNAKGKKVGYGKMLKTLQGKDVVLFGEFHNNPIDHWLELELLKDLDREGAVVIGMEMFEADNQDELNQYLAGEIDKRGLDTLARLWSNYKTDYAPLINYAKDHQLTVAATNIPRRYASQVSRDGFEVLESLSDEEKSWMAPLPMAYDPELPGYKNMLEMMGGMHGGENFPKAQACKDATMAHFILKYHKPGSVFLHYNGAYHSDNYEGILWYLVRARPELRYATISTVMQADIQKLDKENLGRADFIICVDEDMTGTY